MIFHIFGSNTESFKCNSSKSLYTTDNYNMAIDVMCKLSESDDLKDCYIDTKVKMVYKYLYLVADFGVNSNQNNIFTKVKDLFGNQDKSSVLVADETDDSISVKDNNPLPYLIIAIYDPDNGLYSKDDSIVFYSGGFKQEFKDNVRMLNKLIYFIENEIEFEAYIRYKDKQDKSILRVISVSNTNNKKFNINPHEWVPNPIKRERKFYNYTIS